MSRHKMKTQGGSEAREDHGQKLRKQGAADPSEAGKSGSQN